MNPELYDMIYKRKSFHIFKDTDTIDDGELEKIRRVFRTLEPLDGSIRVDLEIVPGEKTTCSRGQEYCILLFSEEKENYLQNIGYIGQQLDLYLASRNIGALWFGIGKTEQKAPAGMKMVIMIAIAKVSEGSFRKDMFKSKRKPLEEIWAGQPHREIGNVVRFAPSACNTQPWFVKSSAEILEVYRYKKPGKRGIMPAQRVTYYNRVDMGIFLLFLELCLTHEGICFERTICSDTGDEERTKTAVYRLL